MDFPIQAPRTDPAALSNAVLQRPAPDQISLKPETARPVMSADTASAASTTAREKFQPLDVYEVGDNDRMPIPPEPPRESAVLAVMANASPPAGVADTQPSKDPMAVSLRDIEDGPTNPTVDIRS